MNAAYKLPILAFMFCTANAYLKWEDYGPEFSALCLQTRDICFQVCGPSDDVIKQVAIGNFVDDEKVKRYILCLWRASKMMDRNLVINKTLLDEKLPEKEVKDNFDDYEEKCLAESKSKGMKESYDTIYDFEKCLYRQNPQDFIMF